MLQSADPCDGALDAHSKPGMRHAAILAQVKIPLEGLLGQVVLLNSFHQEFVRSGALRAADDFSVAFGSEHVDAEREIGTLRIGLHVEGLHAGGIAMDHDRFVVLR